MVPGEGDTDRTAARFCARNASFWLRGPEELPNLRQAVNQALAGFSYYPEMEWDLFGFRPPEGLPFFGAWRTESSTEFVYLVGETRSARGAEVERVLLIMSALGEQRLKTLLARFDRVEARFRRIEESAILHQKAVNRRRLFTEGYPSVRVSAVFGVVTLALNAISGGLRNMPRPVTIIEPMSELYDFSVMCVHIVAVLSLFLLGMFCVIYFLRHIFYLVRL
jgi:hypothetical protein